MIRLQRVGSIFKQHRDAIFVTFLSGNSKCGCALLARVVRDSSVVQ